VEIAAELPAAQFDAYKSRALKNISQNLSIDGFRKGHVPDAVVEAQVGSDAILNETAEVAIAQELPLLLMAEKVLPLTTPKVSISKVAFGNPFAFSARIETLPEVTLPDYKTIAKEYPAGPEHPEVAQTEIDEALTHIRREQARIKKVEEGVDPAQAAEDAQKLEADKLPELDEEFIKSIGYESFDQFKEKLQHNLSHEKARREHEKQRAAMLDTLVSKTTVQLPQSLIEHELEKMEAQLKDDLSQAQLTFEQYLEHAQKNRDDLRKDWMPIAIKRATIQLILSKISHEESIEADQERVTTLTENALKEHSHLTRENVHAYFTQMLRNEAVLTWLESSK
jgi:trigger factor